MKKKIIASLMLAAAAVAVTTSAAWGYTGALSQNSATPGTTITYTAASTGQAAGTPVTFTVTPGVDNLVGSSTVASDGSLSFSFSLPSTATNGEVFTASVTAGTFSDTRTITAVVASTSGLAHTGVDTAPYVWFGGGLLALGIALVAVLAVMRRSRKTQASHI